MNHIATGKHEPKPHLTNWKVGDWVVLDMRIGQIERIEDDGYAEFTDGIFASSGNGLAERFRPLTLRNKVIAQTYDNYYGKLRLIDGEAGFNYPAINDYFCDLMLETIDAGEDEKVMRSCYDKMEEFIRRAWRYESVIDGVSLFRPKR